MGLSLPDDLDSDQEGPGGVGVRRWGDGLDDDSEDEDALDGLD